MWFIPPIVVLVCGVRSLVLFGRIRFIAKYLRLIEEETFASNSKLPGWERYLNEHGVYPVVVTATFVWTLVLVATLSASLYFWFHGYHAASIFQKQTGERIIDERLR